MAHLAYLDEAPMKMWSNAYIPQELHEKYGQTASEYIISDLADTAFFAHNAGDFDLLELEWYPAEIGFLANEIQGVQSSF